MPCKTHVAIAAAAFTPSVNCNFCPCHGKVKRKQRLAGVGESYEDNAVRELEEEMGITGVPLETLFDFFYGDSTCRLWGRLFR